MLIVGKNIHLEPKYDVVDLFITSRIPNSTQGGVDGKQGEIIKTLINYVIRYLGDTVTPDANKIASRFTLA